MSQLSDEQAYAAMYRFLEERWKRLKSDDLGNLLGELSLLADGLPADPAIREEWRRAVAYAREGGPAGNLRLA